MPEFPALPCCLVVCLHVCADRHLALQTPKRWQWVAGLPRNVMGKVNKKSLLQEFQEGKLVDPMQQPVDLASL
jgi:acyl-coenzyme A synthetase/AMP-(fatty) acid ligase